MYHTIQFAVQFTADREPSPRQPLERVLMTRDTCLRVQIKPHVEEATSGPVEVADLFLT